MGYNSGKLIESNENNACKITNAKNLCKNNIHLTGVNCKGGEDRLSECGG